MKNSFIQSENLDQKAYQILKNMIENRELKPGQKIPQEKLAADLGISRTPLISALKFLEHEKLVITKPRRGFFVRLFTVEEMVSIFEIRERLEGLSARRAAQSVKKNQTTQLKKIFQQFIGSKEISDYHAYSKADRQFHNYIAELSSGEFLNSILQTINIVSLAYQYPTREGLIRSPNDTIEEHIHIIEAICNNDADAAEENMRVHLKRTTAKLTNDILSDKSQNTGGKQTRRTDSSSTLLFP